VSHAQILVGESSRVLELAEKLAKSANCLSPANPEMPCGKCISCRVFDAKNHPDTFYVTSTGKSSIGVDDVREQITLQMATKPFAYKYKAFIIDKAETLTPAAQSALLKTIEEPQPYGFFLFLAPNEHSFLPTILSRCYLRKLGGQAESREEPLSVARELANSIGTMDALNAMRQYRKVEAFKESKEDLQNFLDALYQAYGERISSQSTPKLLEDIRAISDTKQALSKNANTQLALEVLLLNLSGRARKGTYSD